MKVLSVLTAEQLGACHVYEQFKWTRRHACHAWAHENTPDECTANTVCACVGVCMCMCESWDVNDCVWIYAYFCIRMCMRTVVLCTVACIHVCSFFFVDVCIYVCARARVCMCVVGLYVYVNAVNVWVEENVHAICVTKTTYECARMIVILYFDVQTYRLIRGKTLDLDSPTCQKNWTRNMHWWGHQRERNSNIH